MIVAALRLLCLWAIEKPYPFVLKSLAEELVLQIDVDHLVCTTGGIGGNAPRRSGSLVSFADVFMSVSLRLSAIPARTKLSIPCVP